MRARRLLLATSALSTTLACAPSPESLPPCPAQRPAVAPPVVIDMSPLDVRVEAAKLPRLDLSKLTTYSNPKGSRYDAGIATVDLARVRELTVRVKQ
jgi:hypothetical protein